MVPTINLSGLSAMLIAESRVGSQAAIASLLAWHRLSSQSLHGTSDGHVQTRCPVTCTNGLVLHFTYLVRGPLKVGYVYRNVACSHLDGAITWHNATYVIISHLYGQSRDQLTRIILSPNFLFRSLRCGGSFQSGRGRTPAERRRMGPGKSSSEDNVI